MKKIITLVIATILLAVTVTPAFALDTRANIRADFYVFDERNNEDATGYAIINYVKGKGTWNITGEVFNMRPDDYTLSVGTAGVTGGNEELLYFTVGQDGYAYFHMEGASLPEEINIARIYNTRVNSETAFNTELTAPEFDGSLKFRGSGRIQENGKWSD